MACCGQHFFRKKTYDPSTLTDTRLARVLNTLDLTALGIGNTLGAGVYVITGQVAKEIAGPAVIISFVIAAVAAALAGLCYAEFGSRVPRAGSAYVYSYVAVGELVAFIIGWNIILEYATGAAGVASGFSSYVDNIANKQISSYMLEHSAFHLPHIGPYPNVLAFGITIFAMCLVCIGVKLSTTFNNVFTLLNLTVILYIIICGAFWADPHNLSISANEVPASQTNGTYNGEGGFLPYGISGMMAGSASCFYAFVGFDAIATTGEEAKNPQKTIPIAIILTLLICSAAYFGVALTLTMMVPYYAINPYAPLPSAFEDVGWYVARHIVTYGAICGLVASVYGVMFPMPRVLYAMASDGLLFRFLAYVNDRFKTPVLAVLVSGIFTAMVALLFDIKQLVEMLSIGTLLAYTLVAICVLVLRYETPSSLDSLTSPPVDGQAINGMEMRSPRQFSSDVDKQDKTEEHGLFTHLFNPPSSQPSPASTAIAKLCTLVLVMASFVICLLLQSLSTRGQLETVGSRISLSLIAACAIVVLVVLWRQPQSGAKLAFRMPLVPLLPVISVFINLYLMVSLSMATWVRFAVWMAIGLAIYFFYGIWHSSENPAANYNTEPGDHLEDNSISKEMQKEPNSKETSKLVKSMFR